MGQQQPTYDPRDVEKYFGKTFKTANGSTYGITADGRFTGRQSIEGARIFMVAGVGDSSYIAVVDALDTNNSIKQKLERIIIEDGKDPQIGLRLVVSLTTESSREKDRYGFITSRITEII